ncbi:P-loop containing nucleoside triphosphate hydrolase protein [Mycena vitilis]|nr:P-loop containing nucleoside triphosphate hydrolase protein [Mycena vitilis]
MPSKPAPRKHGKTPKTRRARLTSKITPEQLAAIREELKLLPGLIKENYTKWTDGAQDFQLKCMGAQKLRQDILVFASTGAGKTGIAAGPHLLPSSKGKVTLVVSPLLSLHEEQVATFRNEFGLKATAINSANGGCTKPIMEGVVNGTWQIVILSPEMLLSRRFIDGVLRKSEFGARCLSVFIDEAHCISHWGDSFRKKYASIGIIRAFLPRSTPFVAVTATLTPRVRDDLVHKLQFNPNDYIFCSIGNDRPNVAQIVRALEHPANSYRDLDFMVDPTARPEQITKAFLYTDDIKDGGKIGDHLNGRVHPDFRSRGLVRPYNAGMSPKYRAEVMALFKAGIVRILICTDAAGMGVDIPDVGLVVQWKLPKNLSSWVQRAGRAARARGSFGMAVMLVEKSAFEVGAAAVPTAEAAGIGQRGRGRGGGRGGRGGGRGRGGAPKQGRDYAVSHGQKRGSHTGADDAKPISTELQDIPADALGEGLYEYIQATTCRRRVLTKIFRNVEPSVSSVHCCDLCNPKLFDHTRPSKPVRSTRQKGIRRGPAVDSVRQALFTWRRNIKKMHYPRSLFAAHALLDDSTCELLSSVGPIESLDMLRQLLESGWSHWENLGNKLYVYLHGLDIPPVPPAPPRQKAGNTVVSTASSPTTSQSSTSAAAPPQKRAHPTHGTIADPAAIPTQRRRTEPSALNPHPPAPSATHLATPRSRPRPRASQSTNPAASSSQSWHNSTPANFQAPAQSQYMPSTPIRTTTMQIPSTYPAPYFPQPYARAPFYPPHPSMYSQHPNYPPPQTFHPHFLHPDPSQTPATLQNNPYASFASPAFSFPSAEPATPVSHDVTQLPPSSDPSSPSFPSNSRNNS